LGICHKNGGPQAADKTSDPEAEPRILRPIWGPRRRSRWRPWRCRFPGSVNDRAAPFYLDAGWGRLPGGRAVLQKGWLCSTTVPVGRDAHRRVDAASLSHCARGNLPIPV